MRYTKREGREMAESRGKRQIRETPALPEDVITEILTCLPVKSLLRFRCVSKSFLTLINCPHFIKRHLNRSLLTKTHHKLILGTARDMRWTLNPHLYSVDIDKLDQALPLDLPCGTLVLGSANGILCLHTDVKHIALWNLATRKYHQVPPATVTLRDFPAGTYFPKVYIVYGFGYDSVSDDFKLFRLVQLYGEDSNNIHSEAKVYNLKSNSWQRIQDIPYNLCGENEHGELACGALHWLVARSNSDFNHSDFTYFIAAFDLATNEYRLVDYPEFLENEILGIVNLKGRLCMLCQKSERLFELVDVWVMKDYGVKDSWSKLFTVSQPEGISLFESTIYLAYSKSGTEIMLLKNYEKILWYSIKEGGVRMIDLCGCPDNFEPEVCVESLVPLISGKAEDCAKKKRGKVAGEKQIKGATKRCCVLKLFMVPDWESTAGVIVEALRDSDRQVE